MIENEVDSLELDYEGFDFKMTDEDYLEDYLEDSLEDSSDTIICSNL